MTAISGQTAADAGLNSSGVAVREGVAELLPRRPVQVEIGREAPARLIRVAVVVPCFNRRPDAEAVLEDLARVELAGQGWGVDLRVLLVDNASTEPLSTVTGSWAGKRPGAGGLWLEHLRSETNTGGSGGYNLGMARVLGWWERGDGWDPDYVWLVDSDARVAPTTLTRLLEVMERDEAIVGAGSVICDPLTGQAFELGGNQNPRTGHFEPMVLGEVGVAGGEDGLVDCDYVAACCALVRSGAIRSTGLFPDRFLNADDVEWFIRMKQRTGGRIVGVPSSLAMHPRFDRFPTWTRYYMCRNALGPLEAVGGGVRARFTRAKQEVLRAVQQAVMGRMDLAGLHVRALKDAAAHRTLGMAPAGVIDLKTTRAWKHLREDLERELGARAQGAGVWVLNDLQIGEEAEREVARRLGEVGAARKWPTPRREQGLLRSIAGAAVRWLAGPRAEIAVVPARGRPSAWFAGRVMVQVTPPGYVIQRFSRVRPVVDALRTLIAGAWHGVRCSLRAAEYCELPSAPRGPGSADVGLSEDKPGEGAGKAGIPTASADGASPDGEAGSAGGTDARSLAVVVLSFNRWEMLRRTLGPLREDPTVRCAGGDAAIVVVDNGSGDGTPQKLAQEFPGIRVIALDSNMGVRAFNLAVESIERELVLVLDDDATVVPRALAGAVELLASRPDLAAVSFLPRHPRTGQAEWAFGERDDRGRFTSDRWPVMGCANLVRRSDWIAAGGYEPEFFLYRNDTDLALKLLAMGRGVRFDSTWIALHDTAAGAGGRKNARWHRTATRNWVWMCRRHGAGIRGVLAAGAGWAWAHRLAGLSIGRQWSTLRGAAEGALRRAPSLPVPIEPDGSGLSQLLELQLGARAHRRLR